MPSHRPHFVQIKEEGFPLNYGDTLGKLYSQGLITFKDIQNFYTAEKLIFWHLYDTSAYVPEEDSKFIQWLNEHIIPLANDTYTCSQALFSFPFSHEQRALVESKAQALAVHTEDF
ncbi:MAG: hypothetical protein ACK4NC_06185 [Candidatus Gracilibacteria bacterium]